MRHAPTSRVNLRLAIRPSAPAAAGVSDIYFPREIVLDRKLDFKKHCKATFGSYIKAHKDQTITNTMRLCMFPGIFFGPTDNCQGTPKVFNINMSVAKKKRTITPLPMPDRVIKVVKDWGRHYQKEDKAKTLKFLKQKWQQHNWDNNDLEDDKGLVWILPITTFPPNFPVSTLNQSNPTTTKLSKLSKKAKMKMDIFMLCNAMHPLMTSPTRLQEFLPPLTKPTHLRSLNTALTYFTSYPPCPLSLSLQK